MTPIQFARPLQNTLLVLLVCVGLVGCSKSVDKPVVASISVDSITTAVPATATTPAAVPTTSTSVPADVKQAFAEADAALKAKAYQKAAQYLLAVQSQRQLTDQQAAEARRRMVGLQSSLADGIANGDPNAIAAAALLRRSATVQ
jgi:hypothetical protein